MIFGTSLANMNYTRTSVSARLTTIDTPVKTAIKNAPVLVKYPRIPKPKLFRSNPYRLAILLNATDGDDIEISDDAKITGYRKQDFGKVKTNPTPDDPEGDITEEIRWKLFLARTAAMIRYQQVHG